MLQPRVKVCPPPVYDHGSASSYENNRSRPRVAMLLWNSCAHDSRVIKEAESLTQAGYEVRVFCLAEAGIPNYEERSGVTYVRHARPSLLRTLAPHFFARRKPVRNKVAQSVEKKPLEKPSPSIGTIKRALELIKSSYWRLGSPLGKPLRHAKAYAALGMPALAFRPAVVHAHDLITLSAATRVAEQAGARLIYDTHEYALNVVNRPRGLSRLQDWLHERKGIRRADAVITVSRSIAGRLKRDYAIARPAVIYNAPVATPSPWPTTIRADLGIASAVPLIVYVGGLARSRGIEHVVSALRYIEGFHLASVGPRNAQYEMDLRDQAAREGTLTRLHFLDPIPAHALIPYLSTADIGVIAYQNVCLNHEYCMPNKLFECVLAGVPLAVSNLRDLRRFVSMNRIGVVMNERDPKAIAAAINQVWEKNAELRPGPDRLKRLTERYSWEAQARKLTKLYAAVLNPAARSSVLVSAQ